jgi:ABC-2 type transport system ATP-binding protein
MDDFILAENLHKSFGSLHAVQGVDLKIAPGEIYSLVGPDGAGKTTTLRILCGALRPDQGQVTIAGFSVKHQSEQARAQIGYLSQRYSLYDDLTVNENLQFFSEARGLPAAEWRPRSQEILDFVGLAEFRTRRAGMLSGGMRQKLSLAVALINKPKVLLLDEPTTGVDPVTRQDFWQLIFRLLASSPVAVLLCTPYMDEAARCSRIGFMRSGKMVVEGTSAQIRSNLDGRILELTGVPQVVLLECARQEPLVESVERFGDRLHLRISPGNKDAVQESLSRRIQQAGGQMENLNLIQPQLEDVFIALSEAAQ